MAYTDHKVDLETAYRTEIIRAFDQGTDEFNVLYWRRNNIEKKYEYHAMDKATALSGAETENTDPNKTVVAKYSGKASWWQIDVTEMEYGDWTFEEAITPIT